MTEWLSARSVRYLVSFDGNNAIPPQRAFHTRIDHSWYCEKPKPVPNFHNLIVPNLSIRATRHYFKKIAVRAYWWRWDLAKLKASHVRRRHLIMDAVNLDFEMLRGMF